MDMINKVIIMLFVALFLRCTPDDGFTNGMVEINGEIGDRSSRLQFGDDGGMEWDRDDKVYMMSEGVDNTIAVFTSREINENNNVNALVCRYNAATCPDLMYRNLYYLGNWRYYDDKKITFSIYEQSGFKSDFGKHFVASARDVMFKTDDKKTYTFLKTQLNSMVSVACFDMSMIDAKEFAIEYANCYNTIMLEYNGIVECDYEGVSGYTYDKTEVREYYESGPLWIRTPTNETYVVMFPQKKPLPNTMLYFKVNGEVVASINFPNGVSANKMYLNNEGKPIMITPEGVKSNEEVVEYNFYW